MKYIVYLTINIKNNHIYIGKHKCEDPYVFDGYLGCGVRSTAPSTYNKPKCAFQAAVLKYGVKNFKRITLKIFDDEESALKFERELVDENFINRKDVYNETIGGSTPPINSQMVYRYSLLGKYLRKYYSLEEAANDIGVSNGSCIKYAIEKKGTCGESLWSFVKTSQLDIEKYNIFLKHKILYQKDLNKNVINTFKSVEEASKNLNIQKRGIYKSISHNRPYKGYYFEYEDLYKNPIYINKKKKVAQYDLNGNFIKEYDSIQEAYNIYGPGVKKCVKGLQKQTKGYIFKIIS